MSAIVHVVAEVFVDVVRAAVTVTVTIAVALPDPEERPLHYSAKRIPSALKRTLVPTCVRSIPMPLLLCVPPLILLFCFLLLLALDGRGKIGPNALIRVPII